MRIRNLKKNTYNDCQFLPYKYRLHRIGFLSTLNKQSAVQRKRKFKYILASMTYCGKNVSFITFNMIVDLQWYYTVKMDSKIE